MRVVIVAGNALAAEGVRRALRHMPNCHVVGFVDGRVSCEHSMAAAKPDLVVVDDMATSRDALHRITEVRRSTPAAKVVLLTSSMDAEWLASARDVGIHAAVSRSVGAMRLGTLVREIAGGTIFHAFSAAPEPAAAQSPHLDALTTRELQILRLVALGASNSRIASELWVTEQTVKFHLSNVYRKLGVANRTEASHVAHLNGLLDPALTPVAATSPDAVAA